MRTAVQKRACIAAAEISAGERSWSRPKDPLSSRLLFFHLVVGLPEKYGRSTHLSF